MRTNDTSHPSSDPNFNPESEEKVWYLSHPLAPDDKYTFEQNMAHVVHLMRIFYEEGFRVIAPYHTICLALDDDNPEWRRIGLECACYIARSLGYVFLTGHKLSSGMEHEAHAAMKCKTGGTLRSLIGYNDVELRAVLRWIKNGGELESDQHVSKAL